MNRAFQLLLAVFLSLSAGREWVRAEAFDLIVRHGRVVDGTGNPAQFADIAIRQGRIAAIGKIEGEAKEEIEAKGLIVAPGFIDVHTHAEEIDELPMAENFARMGVTTLVLGNCGSSVLKVGDFFQRLEKTNISVNVATLIGHGSVRRKAMGGSFERPPTTEEMEKMKEMVGQAMKEGAVGLSTGLIYLPGVYATTEEIIELAKVAAQSDGIYASHMRGEGREIFESLAEVFRIAREAGIRAEVSHIKLSGNAAWGQAEKVLGVIEKARGEGLDITQDQYVYTASSTGLGQLVPEEYREKGKLREVLAHPDQKARLISNMKASLKRNGRKDYSYAVIASYAHDPSLNGLNIAEAAKKKRGSASLANQIELIIEIEQNGGGSGVFHGINEGDLRQFLGHPNTMFASDSGVRRYQEGVPHPRGYGNNARVLGHYVREVKLLRLEEAIRRMTSLPAKTFRLQGRGELREGSWADLVVFDPGKVQDHATFNNPHHYASGFAYVLVNGVAVVKEDAHTGARPGKVLRHASSSKTSQTSYENR